MGNDTKRREEKQEENYSGIGGQANIRGLSDVRGGREKI
jgi:hypothetical protein